MEGISLMLHVCNKTPRGLQSGADTHGADTHGAEKHGTDTHGADTHEAAWINNHIVAFQRS
jgi:hypothetical protein